MRHLGYTVDIFRLHTTHLRVKIRSFILILLVLFTIWRFKFILDIILYIHVSLPNQYPWITFICCNYILANFCNMHEGFLTFYGISRCIFPLGSGVEINNKDYAWYMWEVPMATYEKKVIISPHNMFITWIMISAEISRNVTSASLIWPKAAVLMVILNCVVTCRLLSFSCIHIV